MTDMTDKPLPDLLAEIEVLHQKATPGPWEAELLSDFCVLVVGVPAAIVYGILDGLDEYRRGLWKERGRG